MSSGYLAGPVGRPMDMDTSAAPTFTVVIPFFNEADFLPACLRSWLAQTRRPDQLILVDNASSDGSAEAARALLEGSGIKQVVHLREPRPGKIFALETGCREATGSLIAFADADIAYPSNYLARAEGLFRTGRKDMVAAMALYLHDRSEGWAAWAYRMAMPALSHFFPTKCLTGGGGQVFRAEALRRAGGFSEASWKYVLLDHEVMVRMLKLGSSRYHPDFWCLHTNRRGDRKAVRWNAWERILYLYMPPPMLDWFFHRYLGPRLASRRMGQLGLRNQPWALKP